MNPRSFTTPIEELHVALVKKPYDHASPIFLHPISVIARNYAFLALPRLQRSSPMAV